MECTGNADQAVGAAYSAPPRPAPWRPCVPAAAAPHPLPSVSRRLERAAPALLSVFPSFPPSLVLLSSPLSCSASSRRLECRLAPPPLCYPFFPPWTPRCGRVGPSSQGGGAQAGSEPVGGLPRQGLTGALKGQPPLLFIPLRSSPVENPTSH